VCTALYIAVAAVLTGVVPFRELGVPDPIAIAVDRMGHPGLAVLVKLGALTGLASVLLANAYGQSRICFAIASDRLLPELFCQPHPRSGSLWLSNLVLGAIAAVSAALLPISLLGDMVCLGVTSCFCVVAATLMCVRGRESSVSEGFRVPLGGIRIGKLWLGVVPVMAIVLSVAMVAPVVIDIVSRAWHGDILPAAMLSVYLCLGAVIYLCYGRRQPASIRVELC
jgi:basic amino acid/polyamine antiporter, APA family